jgi:hypothetical protein
VRNENRRSEAVFIIIKCPPLVILQSGNFY